MVKQSVFSSLLQLTKHSAIYGVGHVLTKSLIIFLLPIHTNYVERIEYGIATTLFAFLAIASIIYSYGLNTALIQFYILEQEPKQKKNIFSTAFFATAITSLIFSLILILGSVFFAEHLFDSVEYGYLIRYSAAILSLDALLLLNFNILRAQEKSNYFAFLSVLNVGLNLFFNILLVVHYQMGVKGIFLANIYSSFAMFFVLLPYCARHLGIMLDRSVFYKMLKFGLPFVPATLSIVFINSIDRFFIKFYLGLDAAALYGAGYKLGLIVKLFINAFQFAWLPFFLHTAQKENAKEIFSKILTYFSLICSIIFLSIHLFIEQVVRLKIFGLYIFGPEYWSSTVIVPVVTLAYIAYGIYLNFIVGIYVKEKTKLLMLIAGVGAIFNIVANFILIPRYHLMGAAYATILSFVVMAVLCFRFSQRLYPIQYEFRRLLKIAIFTFVIALLPSLFKSDIHSAVKLIFFCGYFVLLYLSGFFQVAELEGLKQIYLHFKTRFLNGKE